MLKLFFSADKAWIEDCVFRNVGVILKPVVPGKTEFYYKDTHVMIFYMVYFSDNDAEAIVNDLIRIIQRNQLQMLIYNSSDVVETLQMIVGYARNNKSMHNK